ncbi:hypothetical protein NPS74_24945, partial [Cutibacterium acnes subsp. acnes]|nr:hypothetical protein [Cutibacterium acnes subsp. acnes]
LELAVLASGTALVRTRWGKGQAAESRHPGVKLQHLAREASMAGLGALTTTAWFALLYAAAPPFHRCIHAVQASFPIV